MTYTGFKLLFQPKYIILALAALAALGVIIYSNTLQAPFYLDDDRHIADNPAIRDPFNLKAIWDYLPTRFFTDFTLALNYRLHGTKLFGYHLFNLCVHLCSAVIACWLSFLTFLLAIPDTEDAQRKALAHPDARLSEAAKATLRDWSLAAHGWDG